MRGGDLQDAMRCLPITDLWSKRGWPDPPTGSSCHFPGGNRDPRSKASCSIFTATTGSHVGLQLLKNFKTGNVYDGPGLLAAVEGISNPEACRIFMELAGVVKPLDAPNSKRGKTHRASRSSPPPRVEIPKPPPFDFRVLNPRELDADEVEAIATTRGVSARTVESLMKWNVLHAVTVPPDLKLPIPREARPLNAWAFHATDWSSLRLRAFVGELPGFDGQKHKSLTPSGASCSSPVFVGPEDAGRILIVEGEGDALGAVEIIRRERSPGGLAVVVMFSAAVGLPDSFLPRLERRRIRIVPHGDPNRQGEIAAVKWAASARPWAADVQIFSLAGLTMPDGLAVGDLGDLARCPDNTLHGLEVTAW